MTEAKVRATDPRRGLVVLAATVLAVCAAGPAGATAYDPLAEAGSLYNITLTTGAQAYWQAGFTGSGVGVAVIDTGVAPVAGLDAADKVVNGIDVSFDGSYPSFRSLAEVVKTPSDSYFPRTSCTTTA